MPSPRLQHFIALLLLSCSGPQPPETSQFSEQGPGLNTDTAPEPATTGLAGPQGTAAPTTDSTEDAPVEEKLVRSEEEWRELLSPMAFKVTRQAGTERAFTGRYWNSTTVGTYLCVCCETALFRSDAKFKSGCGWPSFFEPLEGSKLVERNDPSLGMQRIEVLCNKCDAHLGHVFPDGPPPTGLRYCINSAALILEEDA